MSRRSQACADSAHVRRAVHETRLSPRTALDIPDIRNSLRSVMGRNVGIVRGGDRLAETGDILNFWGHYTLDKTFDDLEGWELQNMLTVARLVVRSASERTESLGVHFRQDAPPPSAAVLEHIDQTRDPDGTRPCRVAAECAASIS